MPSCAGARSGTMLLTAARRIRGAILGFWPSLSIGPYGEKCQVKRTPYMRGSPYTPKTSLAVVYTCETHTRFARFLPHRDISYLSPGLTHVKLPSMRP